MPGITYQEDDVILFPGGVPGFDGLRRFLLLAIPEYEPFLWLQSLDNEQIRFALVNPLLFCSAYNPKMLKEQLEELELTDKEELRLYVIVTLHPEPAKTTANMAGPVLVNIRKRLGKQIIVDDPRWSVRETILAGGA